MAHSQEVEPDCWVDEAIPAYFRYGGNGSQETWEKAIANNELRSDCMELFAYLITSSPTLPLLNERGIVILNNMMHYFWRIYKKNAPNNESLNECYKKIHAEHVASLKALQGGTEKLFKGGDADCAGDKLMEIEVAGKTQGEETEEDNLTEKKQSRGRTVQFNEKLEEICIFTQENDSAHFVAALGKDVLEPPVREVAELSINDHSSLSSDSLLFLTSSAADNHIPVIMSPFIPPPPPNDDIPPPPPSLCNIPLPPYSTPSPPPPPPLSLHSAGKHSRSPNVPDPVLYMPPQNKRTRLESAPCLSSSLSSSPATYIANLDGSYFPSPRLVTPVRFREKASRYRSMSHTISEEEPLFYGDREPVSSYGVESLKLGEKTIMPMFTSPPGSPLRVSTTALGLDYLPNGQPFSTLHPNQSVFTSTTEEADALLPHLQALHTQIPFSHDRFSFGDFVACEDLVKQRIALGQLPGQAEAFSSHIFNQPLGCCFDEARKFWLVSDTKNGRLVMLNSESGEGYEYSGFNEPSAVCVLEHGKSVAILGVDSIYTFDYDLCNVREVGTRLERKCRGLAKTRNGNLITIYKENRSSIDGKAFLRVYKTCKMDRFKELKLEFRYGKALINPSNPCFLASYKERVVFTDLGEQMIVVLKLDDSKFSNIKYKILHRYKKPLPIGGYIDGTFQFVSGVQMDRHYRVLVCDASLRTVQLFDAELKFLYRVRVGFSVPYMSGLYINNSGDAMMLNRKNGHAVLCHVMKDDELVHEPHPPKMAKPSLNASRKSSSSTSKHL